MEFLKEIFGGKALTYDELKAALEGREDIELINGAGGEYVSQAACRGADAYLTGEMKHHEELEAAYSRLTCVAAGHYHTEKVFAEFLASYLRKRISDTAFLLSQIETAPMSTL